MRLPCLQTLLFVRIGLFFVCATLWTGCASASSESSTSASSNAEADTSTSETDAASDASSANEDTANAADTGAMDTAAPEEVGPECTRNQDCDDGEHCDTQGSCQPGGCPVADRNVCDGCEPLRGELDAPCGVCGVWACTDDGQAECADDGLNSCGSCGSLEGEPETPCDECGGLWVCDETGAAICDNVINRNLCGECQPIYLDLEEPCSCGGTVICAADARPLATCDDGDNYPDTATEHPPTDDDQGSWTTITGTMNVALDEDWHKVFVDDESLSTLRPEFELITPSGHDFDLCVYYLHDAEEPDRIRCDGDARILGDEESYIQDGTTYNGCCLRLQDGATEKIELYWSSSIGSNDDGWAFMRVIYTDGADDCADYTLRYKF